MKTSILICIRSLCLFSLLICLPAFVHAQERLQIADLFSKYGEQKDVTRVELNGSILKSYRMTTYKRMMAAIAAYEEKGLTNEQAQIEAFYEIVNNK
jgi:hypothetical protein